MKLKSIVRESIVIHCPTEALANQVLQIMRDGGFKWAREEDGTNLNHWGEYSVNTYYTLHNNLIQYGDIYGDYIDYYKIFSASSFIAANTPTLIVTGGTVNDNHVLLVTGAEHPYDGSPDFNNLPASFPFNNGDFSTNITD